MADFLLLMHRDTAHPPTAGQWDEYFAALGRSGCFDGGSAIGDGQVFRQEGMPGPLALHLDGFIRVRADSAADARHWIDCNPVYLCGGTVELRELPKD